MTLEMQDGQTHDVNLMDRVQASATHMSRGDAAATTEKARGITPVSMKKKLQTQPRKKKVKGNMGLAIQHGTDVADAV